MTAPAADLPLALLPIRIETRFRGDALLVRLFPDELHVTRHQPGLTQAEIDAGVRHVAAGASGDARAELELAVGKARAAWVIDALRPYAKWVKNGRSGASPLPPPRTDDAGVRALALPERFRVVGYLGNEKVLEAEGAAVAREPRVLAQGRVDDLPFDEATRWLHDFDVAASQGMALTIPLGPRAKDIRASGLSRLVAFGLGAGGPAAGADALRRLLTAQRFDRGAGFLAAGTATNHRAGEAAGTAAAADKNERSARLAAAFGIDASTLEWPGQGGRDDAEARAMLTAVWPATLGAYLGPWMNLSEAGVRWVKDHVLDHLRPLGPLPTICIGRQPYGVLPVTSSRALSSSDGTEAGLLALLQRLRSGPFAAAAARLLQVNEPGTAGVLGALRRTAVSSHFAARPLFGRRYLRNLYQLLRPKPKDGSVTRFADLASTDPLFRLEGPVPELAWTANPDAEAPWLDERRAKAMSGYAALGLPGTPRLASAVYAERTAASPASDVDEVDPFFAVLEQGGLAELRAAQPTTMLGRLVRLSGLRLALELHAGAANLDDEWLTSAPLATLPAAIEQRPEWRAWQQAARTLGAMPDERRTLLWRSTFDAFSHRLDAWLTSFATRRLTALRQKRATGVALGAFGWVENLRPESAAPSAGFLHAPTVRHAASAALLAAGYRAHRTFGNAFQIDLSSARVRRALTTLEAAQAGRSIGEVLGEQLERRLIERNRGGDIVDLRQRAPSRSREPQLDGAALVERYRAGVLGTQATIELQVALDRIDAERAPLVDRGVEWRLALTRDARLSFTWLDGETTQELLSTAAVPLGRWVHVAVVRDATRWSFVVDGKVAGGTPAGAKPFAPAAAAMRLGGVGLIGRLRDVRLWSIARPVASLAAGAAADGPGLVAHWPLDDTGADRVCRDAVGRRDGLLGQGCGRGSEASVMFDGAGHIEIGGGQDLRLGWLQGIEGLPLDPIVLEEIDRVADTTDAMADLVVAESIHQWADGRLDKAGSLVTAFETGGNFTTNFDILSDRSTTRTVLHRLVLLCGNGPAPAVAASQLRARVAPALEAIASTFLGAWRDQVVAARYVDGAGKILGTRSHALSVGQLSSLDLVFGATSHGVARRDEFEAALTHQLFTRRPAAVAKAVRLELAWTPALDGLLEAATVAWRLLTAGRPLRAEDVTWPPTERDGSAAAGDAADALERAMRAAATTLRAVSASTPPLAPATRTQARDALFAAWSAGSAGSVAAPDADDATLRALAQRAVDDLDRRLAAATAASDSHERFTVLAGNGLRFVPALGLSAEEAKTLDAARFRGDTEATEARRWFRQAARVRPAAGALSDALLCAQALGAARAGTIEAVHLPRAKDDRWIGTDTRSEAALSIVALMPGGTTWAKARCGLLLDAWSEQLPAAAQTTGVAFHYDAPGASPPQTILLGVAPDGRANWDNELVLDTILEALELARMRGVTWDEIPETHHFLPAVLLPHAPGTDVLSVEP